MSLYAEYLKEIGSDLIIESEAAFATYRYLNDGKSVYIIDIFVLPEKRRHGACFEIVDMIVSEARKKGCVEMLGTVRPSSPGSTVSLKMQLAYGLTLQSATSDAIILRKDL